MVLKGFLCRGGCNIEFYAVILELPAVPAEHKKGMRYTYWASCIISEWGVRNSIQLGVRLVQSDIVVPEPELNEFNLIGNTGGVTTLAFSGVQLPSQWRDRNKIFAESKTKDYTITRYIVNTQNAFNPKPETVNNIAVK